MKFLKNSRIQEFPDYSVMHSTGCPRRRVCAVVQLGWSLFCKPELKDGVGVCLPAQTSHQY